MALSLSDPFCVDRHRDDFRDLVAGEIDILFANEAEICSLYETDDFDRGRRRGARPCRDRRADPQRSRAASSSPAMPSIRCSAAPVARVVDTTGAGDLYAAGVLFGLTRGLPLPTCGTIGSLCAAEIISHVGARPEAALDQTRRLRRSGIRVHR